MAMMLAEGEASDAELVGLARDGDRRAFAALVERHYDFIHRVAWRWSGNRADAEDVAQEVCARLGKAIRSWKGGGAFTTWLYALTLNAARDNGRKNAREAAKTEAFGVHALIGGEASLATQRALTARGWGLVVKAPYEGAPAYARLQLTPDSTVGERSACTAEEAGLAPADPYVAPPRPDTPCQPLP